MQNLNKVRLSDLFTGNEYDNIPGNWLLRSSVRQYIQTPGAVTYRWIYAKEKFDSGVLARKITIDVTGVVPACRV